MPGTRKLPFADGLAGAPPTPIISIVPAPSEAAVPGAVQPSERRESNGKPAHLAGLALTSTRPLMRRHPRNATGIIPMPVSTRAQGSGESCDSLGPQLPGRFLGIMRFSHSCDDDVVQHPMQLKSIRISYSQISTIVDRASGCRMTIYALRNEPDP